MFTELRRRMEEHTENLNKELENIKKNQPELKTTITKVKNTLEGLNSRLDDTEHVSNLGDRIVKILWPEEQKKEEFF